MEALKDILVTVVIPLIIASIPGFLALIKARRTDEALARKTEAETSVISVELTEKAQDIYQEMLDDLRTYSQECIERYRTEYERKLNEVLIKIEDLKEINLRLEKENKELIRQIELSNQRIKELEERVEILIQQIKDLGETPKEV